MKISRLGRPKSRRAVVLRLSRTFPLEILWSSCFAHHRGRARWGSRRLRISSLRSLQRNSLPIFGMGANLVARCTVDLLDYASANGRPSRKILGQFCASHIAFALGSSCWDGALRSVPRACELANADIRRFFAKRQMAARRFCNAENTLYVLR